MDHRVTVRRETRALTAVELLVVVVILFIAAGVLFPGRSHRIRYSPRALCASNLKQIGIAFLIWADDHGGSNPQALAGVGTNSLLGNVSWPTTGNPEFHPNSPYTYLVFTAMSNELNTPKILVCPADDRQSRTNFSNDLIGPTGAHNLGVSYFTGRDTSEENPKMFLAGDRNICADTTTSPVPNHGYGLSPDGTAQGAACAFPVNFRRLRNLGWSPAIHQSTGNVGLADGSVQQFNDSGLISGLKSAATTNTNPAAQNYLLFP